MTIIKVDGVSHQSEKALFEVIPAFCKVPGKPPENRSAFWGKRRQVSQWKAGLRPGSNKRMPTAFIHKAPLFSLALESDDTMISGNRPPTMASPLRSPYPRFAGNLKASLPESRPTIKFGESSTEEKGVLDTVKSGLKLAIPILTLGATLHHNGNIANQLTGMRKDMTKFFVENVPKPLSTAQWLWQNAKNFCFSAVAAVPAVYWFTQNQATGKGVSQIIGRLSQIRQGLNLQVHPAHTYEIGLFGEL
jgi:hypothetical protein